MSSSSINQFHFSAVSWAGLENPGLYWWFCLWTRSAAGARQHCWCKWSCVSLHQLGTWPRALSLPIAQENISWCGDKPDTIGFYILLIEWVHSPSFIPSFYCLRYVPQKADSPQALLQVQQPLLLSSVPLGRRGIFQNVLVSGKHTQNLLFFSFNLPKPAATEAVWQTVLYPLRWALGSVWSNSYTQKLRA